MSASPAAKKALLLTFAAAVTTVCIILFLFNTDSSVNQKNLDLIHSNNWESADKPVEITHFSLPDETDSVYLAYQNLIQESGFDITPYMGARATRYSYRITNHRDSHTGMVFANIIVCRGEIIAAHISLSGSSGFIQAITDNSGKTS